MPPFGVDVFDPPLHGLVIAEIEFECAEDADAFPGHPDAVVEVTTDERFTGGSFARAGRDELRGWLAGLGVRLVDAR